MSGTAVEAIRNAHWGALPGSDEAVTGADLGRTPTRGRRFGLSGAIITTVEELILENPTASHRGGRNP